MELRSAILWIHAGAAAAWVAASVCFIVAGLALVAGSEEQRNFAMRAASKIDAFNLAAALTLLFTGAANFAVAGVLRGFHFSGQFELILGVKVILFVGMSIALGRALRTAASLRVSHDSPSADTIANTTTRMMLAHGAIVAMGGVALLLGLWLMGT